MIRQAALLGSAALALALAPPVLAQDDELARRSGIAFAESALSLSADFFAVYPVEVPRDAVLAAAESAKLRSP
ncbi:MAG TPA: hypothetical protein VK043_09095 [Burkholderiales bacterium]|nr:hypothetical protein [Burkholderiales bacterium]